VNKMLAGDTVVERPPLVVEIVGLAGAGKTTLLRALNQRHKKIVAGVRVRKINYIPFFISNTFFFLPTFLRQYQYSRWFTWEETRSMVYLKAWHHLLSRQGANKNTVTVFDHGPIFRLVKLSEFGSEITKSQVYHRWCESVFDQWAASLDMVIWLDAPVAILVERIHARNEWHRVKEKSDQEAYKILARFRRSFEQIIAQLAANSDTRVLPFDTERESLKQIVEKVLAEFDLERNQG